nr:hydantoinase/carbamoylase family amidase [Gammaproteobacteria bacterium]
MAKINAARLLEDLRKLRTFGATGNGVVRPSLSTTDMEARRWLCAQMSEAGLRAEIDGVGNVLGRSSQPGKALLIGSHSDTQPTGGWLDGALGVIYGLEIVRALRENSRVSHLPADAISWIDEEGTFLGCLGSRSFCGVVDDAAMRVAKSESGELLSDAIKAAGLADTAPFRLEPDRYIGYLEAHIEQGPYLEDENNKIGVVTSIVGIRGAELEFVGEQNHAGTTPMARRKDAGMALIHFAHELDARFQALADVRTVWTFGKADFQPGAPSIVPGRARLLVQFRDASEERLDQFDAALDALITQTNGRGGVQVEIGL